MCKSRLSMPLYKKGMLKLNTFLKEQNIEIEMNLWSLVPSPVVEITVYTADET